MPTSATAKYSLWAFFKNSSYLVAFAASMDYLGVTPVSVEVLAFFIVADVLTGVLKSGTINGWRSISSSVLERGLIAKVLIILVPLILDLSGKGIGFDLAFLAQSTLNVLILSEAYSVIGNIHSIRTGQITSEFDAVAYVLNGVKSLLRKIIVEDSQ